MTNLSTSQIASASDVATTGSDRALPPRRRPRINTKPLIKLEDLAPRHRLLIEYMVHGVHHHTLADRIQRPCNVETFDPDGNSTGCITEMRPVAIGEPLTLIEAAILCNMRRRQARRLSMEPAFERLIARETAAKRNGAKARAWHRIETIAHDPGLGKAADRKVQLAASQALIGETDGTRNPSVNVTINNQHVTPGYVIDLSPQAPQIEAKANEETSE